MRRILFVVLCAVGVYIGCVRAETMDFPSAEAGHIFISNGTDASVTFYLTGEGGNQSEYTLSAHSSGIYQPVPPSNSTMDIAITTQGNKVVRKLNAGEKYYIDANQQGVFDVFSTQPQQ
ncbi:hypothetical protein AAIG27_21445 [Klebsiella variicola]|uniref:Uncharacterized protein n=1 Tax=Klebsiella variicola TaxID=244366 RepID=A0ABD7P5V1_KLEVA|nr:hypothetical protein [Klebsiella variicola]UNA31952.1 hypothetical protein LOF14_03235 [Klebsiella variicola subsp. variicola]SXF93825.1 Uncharacterised protein [Klebsiella variicola]HBT4809151.1 hypothetical protein [Klebsiella variicola subsp. variicola]HCB0000816.1 hypothetical protein [Klebsiella variicola subsp. variicola]